MITLRLDPKLEQTINTVADQMGISKIRVNTEKYSYRIY